MVSPPLYGPYGSAALAYVARLPAAGANACWFHGFDPQAFDACARHGLAACVEFPTFRADFGAHPELIPIGVDGRPIRYSELVQGVCLSQRDFLDQVEESLLAGLAAWRPAGIWLDYLTYAGWFETPTPDLQESCFCRACIADFCDSTGIDAATPAQILAVAAEQWTAHKCRRIARFGAYYAGLIRSRLPGCVVGAYMCPWTPAEFGGALRRIFAQDYELLAPHIDVFTPLIYATKSGRGPGWAREFLEAAPAFIPPPRPVQLILDVLEFPASLWSAAEAAQPSWGIQIFGGAGVFADAAQSEIFAAAVAQMEGAWAGIQIIPPSGGEQRMNIQDIHLIYNYNYWARDRILIAAGQVTPAQYAAAAAFPYGSLRSTLLHTLDAERSWRHMFEYGHWTPDLLEAHYPTLPILEEAWLEEEAAIRAYLARLADADLQGVVAYTADTGHHRRRILWHCLVHVANHGTQHRAEAAAMLTAYGASPGDLDFTLFLNERGA